MRLAIVSDCHFGFNDDALEQASMALRRAAREADVILLPGDLYDRRVPRQEVLEESVKLFHDVLRDTGVRITLLDNHEVVRGTQLVGIYGTHERRAKGLTNVIQILESAGLMVNAHARRVLIEKDGERVCVQGMGGMPEEYAARALEIMEYKPEPGAFNIFMFHQSVEELLPGSQECVKAEDLPKGFDLYVNGHIHWRQDVQLQGKRILIPGSTVVTQMRGKEAEPKGFYFLDTKTGKAEFIEIDSRPLVYKEFAFKDAQPNAVYSEVRDFLQKTASERWLKKPLVKIKLEGTLAKGARAADIQTEELASQFPSLIAFIDKDFDDLELKERVALVRRLREERKSVSEMGLSVLREELKERSFAHDGERLFALLSEDKKEEAKALLRGK